MHTRKQLLFPFAVRKGWRKEREEERVKERDIVKERKKGTSSHHHTRGGGISKPLQMPKGSSKLAYFGQNQQM